MKNPIDEVSNSVKEYINLKLDEIKLNLVESLSILTGKFISMMLIILIATVMIAFLASAFSSWMGGLLGSSSLGQLITGGVLLVLLLILFLLRNKLFTNSLVRVFLKIFFDNKDKK